MQGHIALIGIVDRHIEESAFRLFLLRKLDTYKSNMGVRGKTLFLVCNRHRHDIQPSGVIHPAYLYYKESNLTQKIRRWWLRFSLICFQPNLIIHVDEPKRVKGINNMKSLCEFILYLVYRNIGHNGGFTCLLLRQWLKSGLEEQGLNVSDINLSYEVGNRYVGSCVYMYNGNTIKEDFRITYDGYNLDVQSLDKEELESNEEGKNTTEMFENPARTFQPSMPKPRTYMALAVLSTFLFCVPLGIVSIVYASKVSAFYISGNYTSARSASKKALTWALINIVGTIIVVGLFFLIAFLSERRGLY